MSELSKKLIKWHKKSGRKNLPWQIQTNPYKVWISEVMLQQTQVQTVIPYYLRFIDRFPDINSLAESNENEVLSYWSGLGYYSRGRNLLKTAKILKDDFNSIMPQCSKKLESLPGIGKSMPVGSEFVSSTPIIGIPNFLASFTAKDSILVSIMKIRFGSFFILAMPPSDL